jgi:hypothetical protein
MFLNRITVTTLFFLSVASMVAAEPKSLILQTEPEPTVIELIGSVEILPSSGDILAVPADPEACSGSDEVVEVSCDDVQVETSSLSVDSNTVEQGRNVRFTWSSKGAWSCAATGFGSWENDSREPFGTNLSVSTSNIAIGTHTAGLTCLNGPVTGQTRSVSITVEEPDEDTDPAPVPAACDGRGMPSNWNRMSTGTNSCHFQLNQHIQTSDCRFFEEIFPFPFDDKGGNQRVMGMRGNNGGRHYVALEFDSGSYPGGAQDNLDINQPQTSGLNNRRKLISISQCPGDFDAAKIADEMGPGCIRESFTDNLRVGGSDFVSDPNRCGLQPNTTYYLNILHTNSPVGTSGGDIEPHPDCGDGTSGCGSRYTWF